MRKWAKAVEGVEPSDDVDPTLLSLLADDLNTAGAIARLHELHRNGDMPQLLSALTLMGR